jgi:hypothetical protein
LNNVNRGDQTAVTKAVSEIKENIKAAKDRSDKLNGSLVVPGVFAKTDTAVEKVKKGAIALNKYITDVDLTSPNAAEQIEGSIYTSGFRVNNRNLKNRKCIFQSVDVKDKVYSVMYENEKTGKFDLLMKVNHDDLCLVNDQKNVVASASSK